MSGIWASVGSMAWIEAYLEGMVQRQGRVRPATAAVYRSIWRKWLKHLGEKPTASASARDAQLFASSFEGSTAQRYGRLLEKLYEAATARGEFEGKNPFSSVDVVRLPEMREPTVALEPLPLEEVIGRLPTPGDWLEQRDQALTLAVLAAGLRRQEVRSLTISQLVPLSDGRAQIQVLGRTARTREVNVEAPAARLLLEWQNSRRTLPLPGKLLFPSPNGRMLPTNTLYLRMRKQLVHIYGEGLPRYGMSILRATFAEPFAKQNRLVDAQHALGHRRLTSTLRLLNHLQISETAK